MGNIVDFPDLNDSDGDDQAETQALVAMGEQLLEPWPEGPAPWVPLEFVAGIGLRMGEPWQLGDMEVFKAMPRMQRAAIVGAAHRLAFELMVSAAL